MRVGLAVAWTVLLVPCFAGCSKAEPPKSSPEAALKPMVTDTLPPDITPPGMGGLGVDMSKLTPEDLKGMPDSAPGSIVIPKGPSKK